MIDPDRVRMSSAARSGLNSKSQAFFVFEQVWAPPGQPTCTGLANFIRNSTIVKSKRGTARSNMDRGSGIVDGSCITELRRVCGKLCDMLKPNSRSVRSIDQDGLSSSEIEIFDDCVRSDRCQNR
ncbi:hypothetical protein WG66_014684 [Moniliophthora roreri]|nr:hypothetical protein WG66_014684 [Moniliophthora roreri]